MGPLEADKPWDIRAVAGVARFLKRFFALVVKEQQAGHDRVVNPTLTKKLHQTIQKITADVPALKFNTAIAALMEFANAWEEAQRSTTWLGVEGTESMVRLLAPFAPFLAEELWQKYLAAPTQSSVHLQAWPEFDTALAAEESVVLGVQVNGKIRGELSVAMTDLGDTELILDQAKSLVSVQPWLAGKKLIKQIYIPGKIISLVVG